MADKVTDQQLKQKLDEMKIWGLEEGKLATRVEFQDYSECVVFANKVFSLAENENHHPKVVVEYGAVEIDLWSHEENGITEKDLDMAEEIEKILR
jgi:4a-hydroxytetrahydrobiopterin dehydratase